MALFRSLTRLQLSELHSARASTLFLSPLKNVVLQYGTKVPRRGFIKITSNPPLRLSCVSIFSPESTHSAVSGSFLSSTSHRWLYTQSGGSLAAKVEDKQPKVAKKPRKHSEHGSVLNELMRVKTEAQPKQLTVGTRVVQAGRDFTYLLVVLGGFVVAGFLLWSVGSEFFSTNSPQTLYSKALKRVKQDPRVAETLGEPISGHGELRSRGRRREPLHQEYVVEGISYMRMKFYVKGTKRSGEVHLDMKKNERGKFELRFLFVELDGHPKGTIVIEDNR